MSGWGSPGWDGWEGRTDGWMDRWMDVRGEAVWKTKGKLRSRIRGSGLIIIQFHCVGKLSKNLSQPKALSCPGTFVFGNL